MTIYIREYLLRQLRISLFKLLKQLITFINISKQLKKRLCLVICLFDKTLNHRFVNKRKRVRFSTISSI